uniref:SOCS box domain-containing protein n=1 Tax=Strigamia maritima TaxID=126957 RepID=T1IPD0_STRMM
MPQVPCTQNLQRELADTIIRCTNLDEIRILLACGAKVNGEVTQGLRPLHYAVYKRFTEAARLLLVRGSEVDARDDVGYSAIHLCAERGYTDLIAILLEHKANVDFSDHDCTDPFPRTKLAEEPLRLAIKNGHFESARFLLENGANPNARYFLGSEINLVNPLDVRFLELLLFHGANANSTDRNGLTPLMKACRHPEGYEAALLLIKFGANVNAMAGERHDFRTVLHYGVLSSKMETVTMLLKQGANVTFSSEYRKPTPLDFAILRGNPVMVKVLLEAGADPNACSPLIGGPLHIACADNIPNRMEILSILLDFGADPNLYTLSDSCPELKPPLGEYIASNTNPDPEVVSLLLKYGASIVVKTQFGDPKGILKAIPRLNDDSHVFNTLLEAAESFNIGAIRRSTSLSSFQKQVLLDRAMNPLSLKHELRVFIRNLLRGKGCLPISVDVLPLPPLVKSYLLYQLI